MKLAIVSDLHLEIWKDKFPDIDYGDADIVIFAGDIGNGTDAFEYMAKVKNSKPGRIVLFVSGNHEFYRHEYSQLLFEMKEAAKKHGIIWLDNSATEINGYAFIGSILWTDYKIGEPIYVAPLAKKTAAINLNDHRMIRFQDGDHNDSLMFTTDQAEAINKRDKQFVFDAIEQYGRDRSIVITHHAPVKEAVAPQYQGDPLNGAFVNGWNEEVAEKGPKLWVHGHTHWDTDVIVGETRVVSRQLGYPGERYHNGQTPFEPMKIELEPIDEE